MPWMIGPVIRFCGRLVTSQRKKFTFKISMSLLHRTLELNPSCIDLEKHPALLLMHSSAQFILERCHLGEYLGDALVHEGEHRPLSPPERAGILIRSDTKTLGRADLARSLHQHQIRSPTVTTLSTR